jgi:hypothetical protein
MGAGQAPARDEPKVYIAKPKRRRRLWLIILTMIVALICLWWFWPRHDRILDLAAELDQRDPGWRWDDLQASQPTLPDAENAIQLLISIGNAIPATFSPYRKSVILNQDGRNVPYVSLGRDLAMSGPDSKLNERLTNELKSELQATQAVRKQLPDLFRYQRVQRKLPSLEEQLHSGSLLPDNLIKLPDLLSVELESALQSGDQELVQTRAFLLLHGLRLYVEGTSLGYGVPIIHLTQASQRLERMLAHLSGDEASLRQIQEELTLIDLHKQHVWRLRMHRALEFAYCEQIANRSSEMMQTRSAEWYDHLAFAMMRSDLIEGRTRFVEYYTYRLDQLNGDVRTKEKMDHLMLQVQKSQPPFNYAIFNKLRKTLDRGTVRTRFLILQAGKEFEGALLQAQAAREVMIVAIAAERFRLKNARWPSELHELVPTFLAEVPKDPCSPGNELRWKVTPTGRLVYSVGLDGKDDGGTCEWKDENEMVDVGFRLFDQRVQQKGKSSAQ